MATPAEASFSDTPPRSLAFVDLSTLTQSELLALSFCTSPSPSWFRPTADLPAIDPSTFNESAGSRKQTFSRPIPSSPSSSVLHRPRVALAGRLPSTKTALMSDLVGQDASEDPHSREDSSIITFLKQSLRTLPEFYDIDFHYTPPLAWQGSSSSLCDGERKRKRGRKPKRSIEELDMELKPGMAGGCQVEKGLQVVNKNGQKVDILALAALEDPYGEELSRRTKGMESEEQLFGFMSELSGQWCSRRRRRRIVDANILGDALPVGWKLLLGLKRKEGRAWVYCRRYVSPGGKQFLSCREVSSYLESCLQPCDAQDMVTRCDSRIQHDQVGDVSENFSGASLKNDAERQSNERLKLVGTNNLAEVRIWDSFKCHKCNMAFDERDKYVQHLLSAHPQMAEKCKLGSTVGDDAMLQEGFECQYCYKMFYEKHQYDSHVETHLDNVGRVVEEKPEHPVLRRNFDSTANDGSPTRISRMDALIEIAQNSMLENFGNASLGISDKFAPDKRVEVSKQEPSASSPEMDMNRIDSPVVAKSQNEKLENIEETVHIVNVSIEASRNNSSAVQLQHVKGNESHLSAREYAAEHIIAEVKECGTGWERAAEELLTTSLMKGSTKPVNNVDPAGSGITQSLQFVEENNKWPTESVRGILLEAAQQASEGNAHCDVTTSLSEQGSLQTCNLTSNQRNEKSTRCEEVRLNEMGLLTFDIGVVEETHSAGVLPIDLSINEVSEGPTFGSSDNFEARERILKLAGGSQPTVMCVWCRNEFREEGIYSEIPSESVGYMCSACKVKISGQIGELETDSSMNSSLF